MADRYRSVRTSFAILFNGRGCSYAPNGRALGMKRHLAVVRCSEASGGGKILFNNVFMSLMLRVG
jgi:hypothetical protein